MIQIQIQGNLVFPERVEKGSIIIAEGKIADVITGSPAVVSDEVKRIDVGDQFIAPGFIDMHLHADIGDLQAIARLHLEHGTTSFLMSLMANDLAGYMREFKKIRDVRENKKHIDAQILGCLLEGPFINPEMAGAQDEKKCILPSEEFLRELLDIAHGEIKMMALAPELPGAEDSISFLRDHNVIPAVGHSNATYNQTMKSVDLGVRHAIHFGNRMGIFHHREPGIIGAVLVDDRVSTGVIADGLHVHPSTIMLLFRLKGKENLVLVTDYVSETVKEHVALQGSTMTLNTAVANVLKWLKLDLPTVIRFVTMNPAQILGLPSKGVLAKGADADIVVFDNAINIKAVYVGGKKIV